MGLFRRKDKDVVAEAQEELARQLAAEAAAPPPAPRPPAAPVEPRPRPAAAPPPAPSPPAPAPTDPPATNPPPMVTSTVVTIDGAPASADQLRMVEGLVGVDLDGDGAVPEGAPDLLGDLQQMIGGAALVPPPAPTAAPAPAPGTTPPPPAAGGSSRLARLERLAALRDAGALTDEEFAAEKQRLLDGP